MEINSYYSTVQLESNGLIEKVVKDISASVYVKDQKVYFFESVSSEKLRLYSIINKRSFFL